MTSRFTPTRHSSFSTRGPASLALADALEERTPRGEIATRHWDEPAAEWLEPRCGLLTTRRTEARRLQVSFLQPMFAPNVISNSIAR